VNVRPCIVGIMAREVIKDALEIFAYLGRKIDPRHFSGPAFSLSGVAPPCLPIATPVPVCARIPA
jgi:hypothetical protein